MQVGGGWLEPLALKWLPCPAGSGQIFQFKARIPQLRKTDKPEWVAWYVIVASYSLDVVLQPYLSLALDWWYSRFAVKDFTKTKKFSPLITFDHIRQNLHTLCLLQALWYSEIIICTYDVMDA